MNTPRSTQAPPIETGLVEGLSLVECRNLAALTAAQRATLDAGLAALKAHNDGLAPVPNLPPTFRAQVGAYADTLIARKVHAARP